MDQATAILAALFFGAGCAGAVIGFGLVWAVILWVTRRR